MSIYQHFRKDEHPFIDQVLEWKDIVQTRYTAKLTDFLDPRQQEIVRSVIGKDEEILLSFDGGFNGPVERRRALIAPFYESNERGQFELVLLELTYPGRFVELSHRDLLGALMSLGVRREKFGDIVKQGDTFQFLVAKEIATFVEMNLTSVGNTSVSLRTLPLAQALTVTEEWSEAKGFVKSFRLDVLLAEIYRLSRTKALPFIEKGRVKVNWQTIEEPSFIVEPGDFISVRGLGRSKLLSIEGESKKGSFFIHYGKKIK
ncbi:RNA-binding protein [Salsuginibacillus kocurii]|uniref:YlmH family RNA-binding protein n=1 Tax=Salsuginibacillus kocurii TaxID=427078 RepID=UPI0003773D1F|nr:YlmH/Sll1252 family protein [Salsuginibacillus kocurii]